MKPKNMTTLHLRKSIDCSPFRRSLVFTLACIYFALSPTAQAVLPSPTPDGGYPGGNTAEGQNALFSLTTGLDNTAIGFKALYYNTTGGANTANGYGALYTNTTGSQNTANGYAALYSNTTGAFNAANGDAALLHNTIGFKNTANGYGSLYSNTTGDANTANGYGALTDNTTGSRNTANGYGALYTNTTGSSNIALGFEAGYFLTTGSNNIDIGNVSVAGEANTIRIGTVGTQQAAFVAGIHGVAVTGAAVVVSSSGQLGVAPSSERFKEAIKPMDEASEAILSLRPVTFHYKKNIDPKGAPQFGLVAEEVEKVNPDLVVRDAEGKVFTVRYDAVNAMLLNEFLKEHRKVEELEAKAARQQEQIEALTAGLQMVSAQVQMSRSVPQMVLNNQ
jgi:hypothetical protein